MMDSCSQYSWISQDQIGSDGTLSRVTVPLPSGFIHDISMADSLANTLHAVARWLPEVLEAKRASIALAASDTELELFAIKGLQAIPVGMMLPVNNSLIGQAYQDRTIKIGHSLAQAPGVDSQILREAGMKTCLDAPLITGEHCYGTLNLAHDQEHFYSEEDAVKLQSLASWLATHIRIHKQLAHITKQATTDALTGLPNRRTLVERGNVMLERWRQSLEPMCVAIMDLDHFKRLNDTYGHSAGDKALVAFAQCLSELAGKEDLVARYGGEEFVACLGGCNQNQGYDWLERLHRRLDALTIEHEGQTLRITVSVGLSRPKASDRDLYQVLARADEALYLSKERGRNRTTIAA